MRRPRKPVPPNTVIMRSFVAAMAKCGPEVRWSPDDLDRLWLTPMV